MSLTFCILNIHVIPSMLQANPNYKYAVYSDDFPNVKSVAELLQQSHKFQNTSKVKQLIFLQQFLLLYNFEEAQKEYVGKYNNDQLLAMLKSAHKLVYEFNNEIEMDPTLIHWISKNIKKYPFPYSFIDSVRLVLNADLFTYEFHNIGNGFVNIVSNVSGVGSGTLNNIVKLTSNSFTEVNEKLLIESVKILMQQKFGNSVYANERDGINPISEKDDVEVYISLHRDDESGDCCPDLFVKCRSKDLESLVPGSVFYHYSKTGDYPDVNTKWIKFK
ncbi:MAG: hypothetical protein ACO3AW_08590 [Chitinophagaceae bacterium]